MRAIYAERMLSAGANGYIMKQAARDQFLVALRRVLDRRHLRERGGRQQHDPEVRGGRLVHLANPIDRLSNRELQILHMIGKGIARARPPVR